VVVGTMEKQLFRADTAAPRRDLDRFTFSRDFARMKGTIVSGVPD
jgi:hypothetical protein